MYWYGQRENVNKQLCVVAVGELSIGKFYNTQLILWQMQSSFFRAMTT
jgi:hypothetical protein